MNKVTIIIAAVAAILLTWTVSKCEMKKSVNCPECKCPEQIVDDNSIRDDAGRIKQEYADQIHLLRQRLEKERRQYETEKQKLIKEAAAAARMARDSPDVFIFRAMETRAKMAEEKVSSLQRIISQNYSTIDTLQSQLASSEALNDVFLSAPLPEEAQVLATPLDDKPILRKHLLMGGYVRSLEGQGFTLDYIRGAGRFKYGVGATYGYENMPSTAEAKIGISF